MDKVFSPKKQLPIDHSPVAIGGVGGSGTRLIAQLLMELGFYMGSDRNDANDNLGFTLLFKRIEILFASDHEFEELVNIFVSRMTRTDELSVSQMALIHRLAAWDRAQHASCWLKDRAHSLLAVKPEPAQCFAWGWKEPNTHIVIDRLRKLLPNMKYIHVMRNGLDMAHSTNQNQLKLWGRCFIGEHCQISPYYSLRYWCKVHQRLLDFGKIIGSRFLLLNYDKFCLNPTQGIKMLLDFLEIDQLETQISVLSNWVKIPQSVGRFKQHGLDLFDPADVAFVRQLGFDASL